MLNALHEMLVAVEAETLIDIVADTVADVLVNALTDLPIEVEPLTQSEHWQM